MAVLIRKYFCLTFMLLAAMLPYAANSAESLVLAEQKIKAGLLYNFLKYTAWPGSEEQTVAIEVCIYGGDPLGGSLQPMEGRSVNQRTIKLRSIKAIAEAGTCNLLFVNASRKNEWPELQKAIADKSILTVSDFEKFTNLGGMIEFKRKDSRVEAVINMEAIKRANLKVEERLLKLVTITKDEAAYE